MAQKTTARAKADNQPHDRTLDEGFGLFMIVAPVTFVVILVLLLVVTIK